MRKRYEGHRAVAAVRDVIEIVAIVAAGVWALYVFAYEQRIKPAGEPAALLLTGSLHRLGEHDGLVQLGFSGTTRNIGQSEVHFIAESFVAEGLTYAKQAASSADRPAEGLYTYQRDARVASRAVVYRVVELSNLVRKSYGSSFSLAPGQAVPFSGIFLVKAGAYDSVALYGSIAFTKTRIEGGYPTKVLRAPNEAVYFDSANHSHDYDSIEVTLDQVSMW